MVEFVSIEQKILENNEWHLLLISDTKNNTNRIVIAGKYLKNII